MRYRLRTLLICTALGAAIGWLVFGGFIGLTPGDPRGPSIAAGAGGLAGLIVGLWIAMFIGDAIRT
jgi:hypothetical protein